MSKKRFKGKMSKEYNLIALAAPHYIDCERKLGEVIKKNFSGIKAAKLDVLEIGCGSGFTSEIILKADKRIHLVAVDNEPTMISQIRRRLEKYIRERRVRIIEGDALEFVKKVPLSSFDALASALTIHNFNFKFRQKIFVEAYRLLKPGGLFVNMDRYAHDDPKIFKKWVDWQIGMYKKVFSKLKKEELISKWVEHEAYDSQPDVVMKMKPAIADMKAAGFKNIKFIYRKRTYSILVARK